MTIVEMKQEILSIQRRMINGDMDEIDSATAIMELMQSIIAAQDKLLNERKAA